VSCVYVIKQTTSKWQQIAVKRNNPTHEEELLTTPSVSVYQPVILHVLSLPPTDKTIREWYMNSGRVAACALQNEQAVRAHRHIRYTCAHRIFHCGRWWL